MKRGKDPIGKHEVSQGGTEHLQSRSFLHDTSVVGYRRCRIYGRFYGCGLFKVVSYWSSSWLRRGENGCSETLQNEINPTWSFLTTLPLWLSLVHYGRWSFCGWMYFDVQATGLGVSLLLMMKWVEATSGVGGLAGDLYWGMCQPLPPIPACCCSMS